MIRKFLSILFAGLILFNLFGYYFVFKCDQIGVRTAMNSMIKNGSYGANCEEITILNPTTNREFKMLDKGEIQYRGKLYDVISTRVKGTSLVFRCINDTKEEQLIAQYHNYSSWFAGINLPERSKNSQAILYHIIKNALLNKQSVQPPMTSSIVLFFETVGDFNSISILPDFPPPRTV